MTTTSDTILKNTAQRCRELDIIVPTFAQMKEPSSSNGPLGERLNGTGLSDSDPANLFRITWKNEPVAGVEGSTVVTGSSFPPR